MTDDSRLSVTPPGKDGGASYEIVWRSAVSALWSNMTSVGSVSEWIVPTTRNNIFMGVRELNTMDVVNWSLLNLKAHERKTEGVKNASF